MSLARFQRLLTRKKEVKYDLSATPLLRCLNVFDLTFLGIGATVGAGLYVVTGQVARDIAGPGVVVSFFIAAVAAFLSGLCYAEFGCRVTKAGSAYLYVYTSMGELWAFIIGWNMILEYVIGTASLGRASSEYIDAICGGAIRNFWIKNLGEWHTEGFGSYPDILAFVLVLLVALVVSSGAKHSAIFNKVVTLINLAVIAFVIGVGMFHINPENWTGHKQFLPYGASGVLAGAASCFYCFVGFDVIATASEETKNPKRAIPLAIMLSLAVSFLAYFGVASVITLMVSYNNLDKHAPLPKAFSKVGLPAAKYVISVGGLCALAGSLLSGIFAVPRIMYAMASDGLLFKCFAKVYQRTNVPVNSVISAGLLAALLACVLDLKQLVEMLSIGTLLAYSLVAVSVIVLRFEPGVQSMKDDLDTASSERSYRVLCCKPAQADADSEYQPLQSVPHVEDKPDEDTKQPDQETSRIACVALALVISALVGFVALMLSAWGNLADADGWAIFIAVLCGLLLLLGAVAMRMQPMNDLSFPFTVPCVPWVPLASVIVNLFLLLKLSHWTWVRFGVWMVLGKWLYFSCFFEAGSGSGGETLRGTTID